MWSCYMGEVWEQADLPLGDPQTPREPTVGRDRSAAGSTPGNNINYIRPVPNTIYYISYLQWQGEVAKGELQRRSHKGDPRQGREGQWGGAVAHGSTLATRTEPEEKEWKLEERYELEGR